MSDITVKATKDFQLGRGAGGPMVKAGQSFPCERSYAAELRGNGLVEIEGGEDLPAPEAMRGSALARGRVLPPVHPVAHGAATDAAEDYPPGQVAPVPYGTHAALPSDAPAEPAPQPAEPAPEPAEPAEPAPKPAPEPAPQPAEPAPKPAAPATGKRS